MEFLLNFRVSIVYASSPVLFGHEQEGRAGGHMQALEDSRGKDLGAGRSRKGRPAHAAQPVHEQLSRGPQPSRSTHLDVYVDARVARVEHRDSHGGL